MYSDILDGGTGRLRCQVIVVDGADRGRACRIGDAEVVIGTGPACALALSDDRVSGRHSRSAPRPRGSSSAISVRPTAPGSRARGSARSDEQTELGACADRVLVVGAPTGDRECIRIEPHGPGKSARRATYKPAITGDSPGWRCSDRRRSPGWLHRRAGRSRLCCIAECRSRRTAWLGYSACVAVDAGSRQPPVLDTQGGDMGCCRRTSRLGRR